MPAHRYINTLRDATLTTLTGMSAALKLNSCARFAMNKRSNPDTTRTLCQTLCRFTFRGRMEPRCGHRVTIRWQYPSIRARIGRVRSRVLLLGVADRHNLT